MTGDEQDAEVGRLFREKRDLERLIACLTSRLQKMNQAILEASNSFDSENTWHFVDGVLHFGHANYLKRFPTPDELGSALQNRQKSQRRLKEVRGLLDVVG